MTQPLFSCVIPVKGTRPFLDDALASLRAQDLGDDLEIIVQDADVEPDCGQSDALNKGFAKAHGEWVFWLNADDVLLPGTLLKVRAQICRVPSVRWIAGNVAYLDAEGRVMWCAWDRGWKCSYRNLHVQVYGPGSFFRRDLVRPFDLSLNYVMDIDFWCHLRADGHWYAKIPDLVWGFRLHEASKTHEAQSGGWPAEIAAEHARLVERYGLSPTRFWRSMAKLTRLLNGSYFKAALLTRRYRNCFWSDIGVA